MECWFSKQGSCRYNLIFKCIRSFASCLPGRYLQLICSLKKVGQEVARWLRTLQGKRQGKSLNTMLQDGSDVQCICAPFCADSRPVKRQKGPIKAILPSVLIPPNLVQTAPSFLARMVGFYVLMRAGISVPYKREVTEGTSLGT